MKLWEKGTQFDAVIEHFTVGDDYLLDQRLVAFDCIASLAHARMLATIDILTKQELEALTKGLTDIYQRHRSGEFIIERHHEDCHTAIENFLCRHHGDAGKKIHTARSRNDQVLTALRLYMKAELVNTLDSVVSLSGRFIEFARMHARVAIPGRTHMQLAMPSSLGLWAGAIAESLLDDAHMLRDTYATIDQCPLGSASSYGTAVPINRSMVAELLQFRKVQNNVLYANNSRGKFEAAVIHALSQTGLSISKAASDLMFFALPEIGYVTIAQELCSGSSLMPQKQNPCALELLRAKSGTTVNLLSQVIAIIRALPSGYHRDFQETKAPLMTAFDITQASCVVLGKHVNGLSINHANCRNAFRPEIFATDDALQLSLEGLPFREAYQRVAGSLVNVQRHDPEENILKKTHAGASGNLGLEHADDTTALMRSWLDEQRQKHDLLFAPLQC
jgi:argininosuccinate lyase